MKKFIKKLYLNNGYSEKQYDIVYKIMFHDFPSKMTMFDRVKICDYFNQNC